jgi:hypothetical protein
MSCDKVRPFSEALTGKIRRPSVCSGELMEASALAAGLNHASLRERLRAKKTLTTH